MRITMCEEGPAGPSEPEGWSHFWIEVGNDSDDPQVAMFTLAAPDATTAGLKLREIGKALLEGRFESGVLTAPKREAAKARCDEGYPF